MPVCFWGWAFVKFQPLMVGSEPGGGSKLSPCCTFVPVSPGQQAGLATPGLLAGGLRPSFHITAQARVCAHGLCSLPSLTSGFSFMMGPSENGALRS